MRAPLRVLPAALSLLRRAAGHLLGPLATRWRASACGAGLGTDTLPFARVAYPAHRRIPTVQGIPTGALVVRSGPRPKTRRCENHTRVRSTASHLSARQRTGGRKTLLLDSRLATACRRDRRGRPRVWGGLAFLPASRVRCPVRAVSLFHSFNRDHKNRRSGPATDAVVPHPRAATRCKHQPALFLAGTGRRQRGAEHQTIPTHGRR